MASQTIMSAPRMALFDLYPEQLRNRYQELAQLIIANPIIIPTCTCRDFLGISDQSLRRAIFQKQIPGSLFWKQDNKQNFAYRIQTLPFYFWYGGGPSNMSLLLPQEIHFDWQKATDIIKNRLVELYKLISLYPISIPVLRCAAFMGISDEGLRQAVKLHQIPGAMAWQKPARESCGYSIQALPFFSWETNNRYDTLLPD